VSTAEEKKAELASHKSINSFPNCNIVPGNVVSNCGFDTGDFTGWERSGDLSFTAVQSGSVAHSGNYGAAFGPVNEGCIAQLVATVAAATTSWRKRTMRCSAVELSRDDVWIVRFTAERFLAPGVRPCLETGIPLSERNLSGTPMQAVRLGGRCHARSVVDCF